MNTTQSYSARAVDDPNMFAILMNGFNAIPKGGRATGDFCTIAGGRIKRRAQATRNARPLSRKKKAEMRADTERRISAIARDEQLMVGLHSRGSGRGHSSALRFVERQVVVDYRRKGCIDLAMRTVVTVECKVRAKKH